MFENVTKTCKYFLETYRCLTAALFHFKQVFVSDRQRNGNEYEIAEAQNH